MGTVSANEGKRLSLGRLVYGTNLRRTLIRAAILGVLVFIVFRFVFVGVRVNGASMAPTYASNGINLVNRLSYLWSAPQRGDVVGVWLRADGHSVLWMKRIVGLPGEAIGFQDGRVTVNGKALDEPYVLLPSDWNSEPVVCGPDEYYIVGDNRSMPIELHKHGRVKRRLIAGKMVL